MNFPQKLGLVLILFLLNLPCIASAVELCSYFEGMLVCSDVPQSFLDGLHGNNTTNNLVVTGIKTKLTDNITGKDVLTPAKPKSAKMDQTYSQLATADLFYTQWEARGTDGQTYGINPKYSIGDTHSFNVSVPMYVTDPDNMDGYKTIGVDGLYKFNWTDNFALGAHANYLHLVGDGSREDTSIVTGGVFAAYLWNISDIFSASFGLMTDYNSPEDGDNYSQLIPAINFGVSLSTNWAINTYMIGYYEIDADDDKDDEFANIGLEVSYSQAMWALNAGVKTTVDLDDYEAVEIYFGSEWRF